MPADRLRAVFPIPQEVVNREIVSFSNFSWIGLGVAEGHNRAFTPANHVAHYLLDLRARPELRSGDARLRGAYEAGVLVGTVLLRRRVRSLGVKTDDCFLATPDNPTRIDWPGMKASRFLLSQFIEGEFDPKPALRQLDSAWNMQTRMERIDRTDDIAALVGTSSNDFLEKQAVITGVGDILASFADLNRGVNLPYNMVLFAAETQNNDTLATS